MEFQYAFEEYQSSFPSFGMNVLPPDSVPSFMQEPGDLFQQDPMPDVFVSQDYSTDSSSFTTETYSPGLPSSTSCSESPAASSPLSSPGGNSVEIKQEPFVQQDQLLVDMGSDAPRSVTVAPERKKKRKQPEPRSPPKHQNTGKKRRAQSDVSDELNPEYLVQMNSVELESMYQQLHSEGRLKGDDEKLFKKIIRQVKNRESAQSSRTRRRDYMEYIEAKLKHEEMVSSCFRDYANHLKDILAQNGMEVPPEPEIPVFVPPPPSETGTMVSSKTIMRPLRTAGICLMLVVLSVGILFNAMHHSNSSSVSPVGGTSDGNNMVSEPSTAAATVDPSARVIVEGSNAPMDQLPKAAPESSSEVAPSLSSSESHHNGEVASLDVIRKSAYLSYDTDKTDSSLALVIPDQKQHVPSSAAATVSTLIPASCPVMRYTTKAIFGDAEPHVADDTWTFDNTSYILVNDAAEFVPRRVYTSSLQARTEPVIGLLLPASSFNISNTAPGDVVELICGVKNANVVPRSVVSHSLF